MSIFGTSLQFYYFISALLLYAFGGSPTPDHFGWIEISVFLLLLFSVRVIFRKEHIFSWVALLYGLSVPILSGVINAHGLVDIIRDIIPFLFLFLPLFYGWAVEYRSQDIIKLYAVMGLIFSIRTLMSYQSVILTPSLWGQGPPADLLYLANSPEVLFSALFLIGCGGHMMMKESREKIYGLGLLGLSFLPVLGMILMTQRAGIGSVLIFMSLSLCILFYMRPKWAGIFLALSGFGIICVMPILSPVLGVLWQKTELVGLNSRAEEWNAVLKAVSQNPVTLLWGYGWGGRFENPAVGGLNVNFTHSLVSSLLLKTGVVGTLVILGGCLWPVMRACLSIVSFHKISQREMILFGAIIFPFLISVFFYASYKSLGFGLILLIFSIFSMRKLERNHQIVS